MNPELRRRGSPAPALGVHGKRDIPYFTPAAQMRFPLYPTARVPRRRYTLYLVLGYGGDLLIAFLKNYRYGLPRFCAAALVAGSLSRTLRQGMAALNAQFMSAFTAAPL
jgi:hypothetical protein